MKWIMTWSLVVCFLVAGQCAADDSLRPYKPFPLPDLEAMHRADLKSSRREEAFLKETIAWQEKMIADYPDVFTPEKNRRFFELLNELRSQQKKQEKWVQELERWDRQRKLKPGLETEHEALIRLRELRRELWPSPSLAPPPREKKK